MPLSNVKRHNEKRIVRLNNMLIILRPVCAYLVLIVIALTSIYFNIEHDILEELI